MCHTIVCDGIKCLSEISIINVCIFTNVTTLQESTSYQVVAPRHYVLKLHAWSIAIYSSCIESIALTSTYRHTHTDRLPSFWPNSCLKSWPQVVLRANSSVIQHFYCYLADWATPYVFDIIVLMIQCSCIKSIALTSTYRHTHTDPLPSFLPNSWPQVVLRANSGIIQYLYCYLADWATPYVFDIIVLMIQCSCIKSIALTSTYHHNHTDRLPSS